MVLRKKMKRLSASIPDLLYKKLENVAEMEGRSVSNLVSFLLEQGVELKLQSLQSRRGGKEA